MLRKLGIAFCVLGFIAVCVLALVLPTKTNGFAGLNGIQAELADRAVPVVAAQAPLSEVTVRGRVVNIDLPETVPAGFDRGELRAALKNIDGVRAVTIKGDPLIDLEPGEPAAPAPTDVPEADPAPDPDPTATTEPDPEPTATPEPAPVTLSETVDGLRYGPIDFLPGTAELSGDDEAELDGLAEALRGLTGGPIEVQAHTDNVGDPDVNLLLSQDRAQTVTDYLIDQGVDAALLSPRGFGASDPIADNSTEQGRADNQRVVLVVEGN